MLIMFPLDVEGNRDVTQPVAEYIYKDGDIKKAMTTYQNRKKKAGGNQAYIIRASGQYGEDVVNPWLAAFTAMDAADAPVAALASTSTTPQGAKRMRSGE